MVSQTNQNVDLLSRHHLFIQAYLLFGVEVEWHNKAWALPAEQAPGRQSSHLPSVVIHTYPCQSSPSPSGFIKLFLPNTYTAVSEWSPSKHSLLHFTTFLSTAGVVANLALSLISALKRSNSLSKSSETGELGGDVPECEVSSVRKQW